MVKTKEAEAKIVRAGGEKAKKVVAQGVQVEVKVIETIPYYLRIHKEKGDYRYHVKDHILHRKIEDIPQNLPFEVEEIYILQINLPVTR